MSKESRVGLRHCQWDQANMEEALKIVNLGLMSTSQAAREFDVPRNTLADRVKRRVGEQCSPGRKTKLTAQEEEDLCSYIAYMAGRGFPMTIQQILMYAWCLDKASGRNVFPQNGPSYQWWAHFKKRHSDDVRLRKPDKLDRGRAIFTTVDILREYFQILKKVMDEEGFHQRPEDVWNCDESMIDLNKCTQRVVVPARMKSAHSREVASSEHVTIHCCISASGSTQPPFIIFKNSFPGGNYAKNGIDGALYGRQESGFMDTELFLKWFSKIFIKYSKPTKERSVLLLLDGHITHCSPELIRTAKQNNVILLALPPHTTHVCQPLDVAVYKSLKAHLSKLINLGKALRGNFWVAKKDIASLIKIPFENAMSITNIKSGFRKCGVYPFNPNNIDKNQLLRNQLIPSIDVDLSADIEPKYKDVEVQTEPLDLIALAREFNQADSHQDVTISLSPSPVEISNINDYSQPIGSNINGSDKEITIDLSSGPIVVEEVDVLDSNVIINEDIYDPKPCCSKDIGGGDNTKNRLYRFAVQDYIDELIASDVTEDNIESNIHVLSEAPVRDIVVETPVLDDNMELFVTTANISVDNEASVQIMNNYEEESDAELSTPEVSFDASTGLFVVKDTPEGTEPVNDDEFIFPLSPSTDNGAILHTTSDNKTGNETDSHSDALLPIDGSMLDKNSGENHLIDAPSTMEGISISADTVLEISTDEELPELPSLDPTEATANHVRNNNKSLIEETSAIDHNHNTKGLLGEASADAQDSNNKDGNHNVHENPLYKYGLISEETVSVFFPPKEEILPGRKRPLRIKSRARVMTADEVIDDLNDQREEIVSRSAKRGKATSRGRGRGRGNVNKSRPRTKRNVDNEDFHCYVCNKKWELDSKANQRKWVGCEASQCPKWICTQCLTSDFDYSNDYYCQSCEKDSQ